MSGKRLERKDGIIAGVCAGLGDYLNLDPVIIRIAFILLVLFAGGGGLIYVILWIAMKKS